MAASSGDSSNSHHYLSTAESREATAHHLAKNDFRSAIISAFNLPLDDSYVYHAIASVTLAQAQAAVQAGTANGLCDWYVDDGPLGHPSAEDISAYTTIFEPGARSYNALKSFAANARRDSLRKDIAERLLQLRHVSPALETNTSKKRTKHTTDHSTETQLEQDPAFPFWAASCRALHWAGPHANSARVQMAHPLLPIFMHHFGCVIPSGEALQMLRRVSEGRAVVDMGSGNGYWSYQLRRFGITTHPVDSGQSTFRACWIADTEVMDGIKWLRDRQGAPDHVLLLVYPIVSGDFLPRMVATYRGDTVCVAGTQNSNGYTAFRDTPVDQWFQDHAWSKDAQIPLPSFAGKDEALYIFRRQN